MFLAVKAAFVAAKTSTAATKSATASEAPTSARAIGHHVHTGARGVRLAEVASTWAALHGMPQLCAQVRIRARGLVLKTALEATVKTITTLPPAIVTRGARFWCFGSDFGVFGRGAALAVLALRLEGLFKGCTRLEGALLLPLMFWPLCAGQVCALRCKRPLRVLFYGYLAQEHGALQLPRSRLLFTCLTGLRRRCIALLSTHA